jgi:NAD(P)-dependent dehydrogenase (short-subunit alcohol dehydrogenase family)
MLNHKRSLGRTGISKDLESAIQFLCSEKLSYLTGTNLVADGGWSVL